MGRQYGDSDRFSFDAPWLYPVENIAEREAEELAERRVFLTRRAISEAVKAIDNIDTLKRALAVLKGTVEE